IYEANADRFPPPAAPAAPAPDNSLVLRMPVMSPQEAIDKAYKDNPQATDETVVEWIDTDFDGKQYLARMTIKSASREAKQWAEMQRLYEADKDKPFKFDIPWRRGPFADATNFGNYGDGVATLIRQMTAKRGYDLHQVIDELKDQPAQKAIIRQM